MAQVYLGLGSNLGHRRDKLRRALASLERHGVHLLRASSLYETSPMYYGEQPAFLNAVVYAETELSPEQLLDAAKSVEAELGRQERFRNGPREIDVDILLYANECRASPELTLPHPRMLERPFVQIPLAELRGEPAADTSAEIRRVEGPAWTKPEPSIRAFVAIDVSDELRRQVANVQAALRPVARDVIWVQPELCHLTLQFLGSVPPPALPAIVDACRAAVAGTSPFELRFGGVGTFPQVRRPRVLWIGLTAGLDQLSRLQQHVQRQLANIGFAPEERPFSPHLTLGRFRQPPRRADASALEAALQRYQRTKFATVSVAGVQLMRSVLHPSGPEYSVIESFPLIG